MSNIRPKSNYLVANASDNLVAATTAMTNTSTGAVNLNDGQIGIFQAYPMDGTAGVATFMTALDHTSTPTIDNAPWIQIFQGTADSANPSLSSNYFPLSARPYETSEVLKHTDSITATYQAAVTPQHSIWQVGAVSGGGMVNAADNTVYSLTIAYRGRIADELNSPEATAAFFPSTETPDFTTLGTAEPRDYLLQKLAYDINRGSYALSVNRPQYRGNQPVVAFLIDDSGAAGTTISSLTAGTALSVVNTSVGVRKLTLTQAMVDSINDAATAAGLANTATILINDTSTAGTTTGGVADCMFIMALDRQLAYDDRIPQVKVRLEVGLTTGFDPDTVTSASVNEPLEGQGQGRQLYIRYKNTQGQRKYNALHLELPQPEYPNPFDLNTSYGVFAIRHDRAKQVDTGSVIKSPFIDFIAVPSSNTTLITNLTTALNAWLQSFNNPGVVQD